MDESPIKMTAASIEKLKSIIHETNIKIKIVVI